jgi:hypothetical protein
VYFNLKDFAEIAKDAEKAGKRHGNSILFRQKEHGFSGQEVANRKGIAKFLKYCWEYWRKAEPARLEEAAKLKAERQRIDEELKKAGMS